MLTRESASFDVWITAAPDTVEVVRHALGAEPRLERSPSGHVADAVAMRVPAEALPWISEAVHRERGRCGGYVLHASEAAALKALQAPPEGGSQQRFLRAEYKLDNASTVEALMVELDEPNVLETIRVLSSFRNRFHGSMTGQDASYWIRDAWLELARGRDDVVVELVEHDKTPQPSIAMTVRGTSRPDELVVLGGHMDSIAGRGSALSVAPGADDNASGIATLTEIARAAIALDYRPERTVVFYAYAAEEVGLVGSGEIAAKAASDDLAVVGVMQLDMTNFTSADTAYISLISDYTDEALNAFSIDLIEAYLDVPWKYHACGYACSDHASWNRHGFPATFPHEAVLSEGNQAIHTANDTLALSNDSAQHSMHFARFGAAFMAELAKGEFGAAVAPCQDDMGCEHAGPDAEPQECDDAPPCPAGSSCEAGACVPSATPAHDAGSDQAGSSPGAVSDAGDAEHGPGPSAAPPTTPGADAPAHNSEVSAGCSLKPSPPRPAARWLLMMGMVVALRRGRIRRLTE